MSPVPSRSAIYRCVRRHALIELRRRRKRRDEFRRWERERPMQLWQMDVMGGVLLSDGSEAKVVTGIDDHSRFCVAAGLVTRATSKAVCEVLAGALARYGIPDEILTDNGKVFTGRFGPQPVEVLFDRILRENGISHRHTGVRSPTTTGKIERFHQSLRREFLADRAFGSLEAAQGALDAWVHGYNSERPHQALETATPADRFRLAPIAKDASSVPVDQGEDHAGQWVLRRVASNGVVSVNNQMFSVGNAYKAETHRRLRGRHRDPGLEQEPPHQDRSAGQDRGGPKGPGGRPPRQTSADYGTSSISWHLTGGTLTSADARRSAPNRHHEPSDRLNTAGMSWGSFCIGRLAGVDDAVIQVWSKNPLIKTVARTRTGPVRTVRADGLHVKHQPDTKRQASGGT